MIVNRIKKNIITPVLLKYKSNRMRGSSQDFPRLEIPENLLITQDLNQGK